MLLSGPALAVKETNPVAWTSIYFNTFSSVWDTWLGSEVIAAGSGGIEAWYGVVEFNITGLVTGTHKLRLRDSGGGEVAVTQLFGYVGDGVITPDDRFNTGAAITTISRGPGEWVEVDVSSFVNSRISQGTTHIGFLFAGATPESWDAFGGAGPHPPPTLLLDGPPAVVSPPAVNFLTATSARLGCVVTTDGGNTLTESGIYYSLTAVNSNPQAGGNGVTHATTLSSGNFTILVSLTPATSYSFRAYVTNIRGTASTTVRTFTTPAASPPAVTTPTKTNITAGSATLGGNATSAGSFPITERGIVYSITTENANPLINGTGVTKVTTSGTTGVFTVNVTSLVPLTGYSFKAYATNSAGTTYTNPASTFTTLVRPLVFIPGMAGSDLNEGGANGTKRWMSVLSSDIDQLELSAGADVVAVDILRTALGVLPIYQPTIDHLTEDGPYEEFDLMKDRSRMAANFPSLFAQTPTLFCFPYDWRKDDASHIPELGAYITNIRTLHGGAQVDILAHSMGGLVGRRYALEHPEDIVHMVTVASPFWGAPKAIRVMLAGHFLDLPVDYFINASVKRLAASSPGVHCLLPSDYYLQNAGSPVMTEDRWNINNNPVAIEPYTTTQLWSFLDQRFTPNAPSQNSRNFHNYQAGAQDDWSGDTSGIKYLQICGLQAGGSSTPTLVSPALDQAQLATLHPSNNTVVEVTAKQEVVVYRDEAAALNRIAPTLGPGDGTVPLLSAQRMSQFLAPGQIIRVVSGPDSEVEHNPLMGNPTVFALIDAFLADVALPEAASLPDALLAPAEAAAPPVGTVATQQVVINGVGYLRIVDSLGNENELLSEIAAKRIPGLSIEYGGSEGYVDITAKSDVDFLLEGTALDPEIDIKVAQLGADGTALSLRRYQFEPDGHAWKADISASTMPSEVEPVISVDTNDNGTFEPVEALAPTYSSGNGPVDNSAPVVEMNISAVGDAIVLNLAASDETTPSPSIRYSVNDGPIQSYEAPLSFAAAENSSIQVFAIDNSGNTSGLITSAVRPSISIQNSIGNTVTMQWPTSEAYVLEETDNLANGWSASSAQITPDLFTESATIPIGTSSRRFFRLRSRTATK